MGVADKFRRTPKPAATPVKEEKNESLPELRPLDILLDGTFPRSVGTEEKVEYIPLTIAEEQEVTDPHKMVVRMLAKAIKYRLDNGLDTPKSAGLDETKSIEANVESMLGSLPGPTRSAISMAIQIDVTERFKAFLALYKASHETYIPDDKGGPDRKSSKLDAFVTVYNNFKESGYTLAEVAKMTTLQYEAFSLIRFEAMVRQANDHTSMSERIKSKAAGGAGKAPNGAKKRNLVGS